MASCLDITEERRRQAGPRGERAPVREMAEAVHNWCPSSTTTCAASSSIMPATRPLACRRASSKADYLGEILDPAVWKTVEPKLRRCLRREQVSFDSEGELDDGRSLCLPGDLHPGRARVTTRFRVCMRSSRTSGSFASGSSNCGRPMKRRRGRAGPRTASLPREPRTAHAAECGDRVCGTHRAGLDGAGFPDRYLRLTARDIRRSGSHLLPAQ